MSWEAVVIGAVAWAGGLVAWLVTAVFEHRSRYAVYRERRAEVVGGCKRDVAYSKEVGDVEQHLANQGVPRPGLWHCVCLTAYQPLLTLAIIVLPTFRVWDFQGWVTAIGCIFAMVAILLVILYHEYQGKDDYIDRKWYQVGIILAWLFYLLLVLWLAHCSEDSARKPPAHQPATQGPAVNTSSP